eukprot:TRINITY_DN7613_c0_g1_i1.p1 TRINITY_DN7613_c0_g1~~TRINITY_DN7613_c0_g1_i1.p1  ORF type:complete len:606 (+),score=155.71 TRINITY_DN7613_c0_g1_i1:52-1869(+)
MDPAHQPAPPSSAAARSKRKKRKPKKKPQANTNKSDTNTHSDAHSGDDDDFGDSEDEGEDGYKKGGYHRVNIGDVYNKRYVVIRKTGWGHFSTCWLCLDTQTGDNVVLKVQKSASHYTEAAYDEIKLLEAAYTDDPLLRVVRLLDNFTHKGPNGLHVCMVFEVLGSNLLSLIKLYNYRGIPLAVVKRLCFQIMQGLDHLHRNSKIIHTDLKPENILLTSELPPRHKKRSQTASAVVTPQDIVPATVQYAAVGTAVTSTTAVPSAGDNPASGTEQTVSGGGGSGGFMLSADQRRKLKKKIRAKQKRLETCEAHERDVVESQLADMMRKLDLQQQQQPSTAQVITAPAQPAPTTATTTTDAVATTQPTAPLSKSQKKRKKRQAAKAARVAREVANADDDEEQPNPFDVTNPQVIEQFNCKIIDLGNACWTYHHFTEQIQTRQYRSPEVLLGHQYDTSTDMWSMACIVFELVTGDLLFDPHSSEDYERDEDHLAQITELLGGTPRDYALSGKYSKEFYNRDGSLKHISNLHLWDIKSVLMDKYSFNEDDAADLASFIEPMLQFDPKQRATAEEMLQHPWLETDQYEALADEEDEDELVEADDDADVAA